MKTYIKTNEHAPEIIMYNQKTLGRISIWNNQTKQVDIFDNLQEFFDSASRDLDRDSSELVFKEDFDEAYLKLTEKESIING